jgi:hypothetical protein
MPTALGPWRFLGRWIIVSLKNSWSRTGRTPAGMVYATLGAAIGFYFCFRTSGPTPALFEQAKTWALFTVAGGAASWGIAMVVSIITAPFHMHREDYMAFAGVLSARESETDAKFTLLREELRHAIADLDSTRSERDGLRVQNAAPLLAVGDVKEWMYDLARAGRALSSANGLSAAKAWLTDATIKINKWLRKHQSDTFERTGQHLLNCRFPNDQVRLDNILTECPAWIERTAGVLTEHDIRVITLDDARAVLAA